MNRSVMVTAPECPTWFGPLVASDTRRLWDDSDMTGIIGESKWSAMLDEGERDATDEEIVAIEAEHGPFLLADGEG